MRKLESNIDGQWCMEKEGIIKYLEEVIEQKDNETSELKQSCEYLNDLLNDNATALKNNTVFDEISKTFSTHFKQYVNELLQLNVSASKVSNVHVIKSVLKVVNIQPQKTSLKVNYLKYEFTKTVSCSETIM